MSSIYRKINYVREGSYGSTEHKVLYGRFNASNDSVDIRDENGEQVLFYGDWGMGVELDLGQALIKLIQSDPKELDSPNIEEIHKIFK